MDYASLPKFKSPPVIETVLSVQFTPLDALVTSELGRFWDTIRPRYPTFEIMPPLPSMSEQFGTETSPSSTVMELTSEAHVRCWFVSDDKRSLIQLQSDRLIHNWRRIASEDQYPQYTTIRPKFETEWRTFCEFLRQSDLGEPEVNQCEVTYVNHIEVEYADGRRLDIRQVSPLLARNTESGFLPSPSVLQWSAVYEMTGKLGRLHVSFKPALRRSDGKRLVILELTARGAPNGSSLANVLDWFDLGHAWVVRGFKDLTSRELHTLWGEM
ncbi:MAG: TIGR04255 family protein [candidate division Zixibacteria bacterium]|nr:TIGR04255 family protein [candidate division Zixibacteria bacterium]